MYIQLCVISSGLFLPRHSSRLPFFQTFSFFCPQSHFWISEPFFSFLFQLHHLGHSFPRALAQGSIRSLLAAMPTSYHVKLGDFLLYFHRSPGFYKSLLYSEWFSLLSLEVPLGVSILYHSTQQPSFKWAIVRADKDLKIVFSEVFGGGGNMFFCWKFTCMPQRDIRKWWFPSQQAKKGDYCQPDRKKPKTSDLIGKDLWLESKKDKTLVFLFLKMTVP